MMRPVDITGQSLPDGARPNPGPAPMMDWVPIERLVLDEAYQRSLQRANWDHIRQIAAAFSWSRFAPLLVAPVEGGRFAIVDGQHRAHAAALCGIDAVPAMIVHMSRSEQAGAFAWVNGQVKRVTPMQMYRAALAAQEPWAVACARAVEAAGCRMMDYNATARAKRPGEVFCVTLVRKAVAEGHSRHLTAALAAMRAHDDKGRVALWSGYILEPWVRACCDVEMSYKRDLLSVLRQRDPFRVVEAAERLQAPGGVTRAAAGIFADLIRKAPLLAATAA